jgi:hypothetical protein
VGVKLALAAVKFKQENPAFKRFEIERTGVEEDKFADKVGAQFVSTVYHGNAIYRAGGEPDAVRFICLHAVSIRALFSSMC